MGETSPVGGDIIVDSGLVESHSPDKSASRDETPKSKREALPAFTYRVQVEAITKAVGEVLECFGFDEVECAEVPNTTKVLGAKRGLTVMDRLTPTGRGDLHGVLLFGFESAVAGAFAGRIASFMFDEEREVAGDEISDLVKLTLGEMASFTLLATLNSLGLPPEPVQPRFVDGEGTKLWPAPAGSNSLRVTTDVGAFEIAFVTAAPGWP